MSGRAKLWVVVGVVVALGVLAVLIGPGLYANWANDQAAVAPTIDTTAAVVEAQDGTWTVGEGSFAGYRVEEVLRGQDVTVTGRTEQVTGEVVVADGVLTEAQIEVDMASIATDQPPRDGYFRDQAIDVRKFPTGTFTLTEPADLDGATVQLTGELTIRDVTREVTVDAQVAGSGGTVQVVGSAPITFTDFGVTAPSLGFVTVEEDGFVEFDLRLTAS